MYLNKAYVSAGTTPGRACSSRSGTLLVWVEVVVSRTRSAPSGGLGRTTSAHRSSRWSSSDSRRRTGQLVPPATGVGSPLKGACQNAHRIRSQGERETAWRCYMRRSMSRVSLLQLPSKLLEHTDQFWCLKPSTELFVCFTCIRSSIASAWSCKK